MLHPEGVLGAHSRENLVPSGLDDLGGDGGAVACVVQLLGNQAHGHLLPVHLQLRGVVRVLRAQLLLRALFLTFPSHLLNLLIPRFLLVVYFRLVHLQIFLRCILVD